MTTKRVSLQGAVVVAASLLLMIFLVPNVLATATGAEGDVYLPVLRGEGEASPLPATPTPVPTAAPQPTLDPNAVATTDGTCPSGFHLINESGALGIINPDDFDGIEDEDEDVVPFVQAAQTNLWDGYFCVPDQDLSDISCSGHGAATLVGGVATCSCDEGYVGRQCIICGPGYVLNGDKTQCVASSAPAPAAIIQGADDSVDAGTVVELRAVTATSGDAGAAQAAVSGQWQMRRGYRCLLASPDSDICVETVQGETAYFKAPTEGELNMAGIQFLPDSPPHVPVHTTVVSQPPGYIPINGFGKPELQPILDNLLAYMKTRCIGAAVLGVSYFGQPVGVWGLGKTFGRDSSTIFDPKCGTDADDPHVPSAPNTGNQMGIMIGSVSKTVTWATARWTFKNEWLLLDSRVVELAKSYNQIFVIV